MLSPVLRHMGVPGTYGQDTRHDRAVLVQRDGYRDWVCGVAKHRCLVTGR